MYWLLEFESRTLQISQVPDPAKDTRLHRTSQGNFPGAASSYTKVKGSLAIAFSNDRSKLCM